MGFDGDTCGMWWGINKFNRSSWMFMMIQPESTWTYSNHRKLVIDWKMKGRNVTKRHLSLDEFVSDTWSMLRQISNNCCYLLTRTDTSSVIQQQPQKFKPWIGSEKHTNILSIFILMIDADCGTNLPILHTSAQGLQAWAAKVGICIYKSQTINLSHWQRGHLPGRNTSCWQSWGKYGQVQHWSKHKELRNE